MSASGFIQFALLILALAMTVPPLGRYLAGVYEPSDRNKAYGDRFFSRVEATIYRICGIDRRREQRWNIYCISLIAFSVLSFMAVYVIQRVQSSLPMNPTGAQDVSPEGAFNVAISFVTNTNWQWYSGEVAMSHLTQMTALTVQNFVSAAAGLALAVALIRGITRRRAMTIGNFWVDLVRGMVRVLIPLAMLMTIALLATGVVQNFHGFREVTALDTSITESISIPGGPVASQEAIKQLGSNGGGFFNANSAHPFENPNGLSNFLELFMILLIPFGLVAAYGRIVNDRRQARVLVAVMASIWLMFSFVSIFAEQSGNHNLARLGIDQSLSNLQSGGNLEGKEVRFGPTSCGMWAGATTGTSNGSVNCMHDSFTPIGGASPLLQMMLGEISPGGVGVGLMGILMNALLAVFIAGLMVGRTPEYLGKKIQVAEMKLLVLYMIAMPMALLPFAAASVLSTQAQASILNPGAHGLSEVLYAFASSANNNGSALAGLSAGTKWYTITQGLSMLIGRFFLIIPALAIGGSLARKPVVPTTSGTLPTNTFLFGGLLLGVIAIIAGLTFFPALALGPIVEQLTK